MWNGCGEVIVGKDFWRSCGCSLVGRNEEDLVWGCIENFNECSSVREWIFFWSLSGKRDGEIEVDMEGVFEQEDLFLSVYVVYDKMFVLM